MALMRLKAIPKWVKEVLCSGSIPLVPLGRQASRLFRKPSPTC
ncbi:hypothetical protein VPHK479_0066 [Vibrio phage K479]